MGRLDEGEYRTVRGMRAPTLDVLFVCTSKDCPNQQVLDAYRGPPTCMGGYGTGTHPPAFMVGMTLIKDHEYKTIEYPELKEKNA